MSDGVVAVAAPAVTLPPEAREYFADMVRFDIGARVEVWGGPWAGLVGRITAVAQEGLQHWAAWVRLDGDSTDLHFRAGLLRPEGYQL